MSLRPVHGELAFPWCLAPGPTHSSCSVSAAARILEEGHSLLQRPFRGRELSGFHSEVPGFVGSDSSP